MYNKLIIILISFVLFFLLIKKRENFNQPGFGKNPDTEIRYALPIKKDSILSLDGVKPNDSYQSVMGKINTYSPDIFEKNFERSW